MSNPYVNLNYACEESIVSYLIGYCDPLQTTASYYTGVGNVTDLQAPAVFVVSEMGMETYPLSNVYDILVTVSVKEMAADVATNPAGSIGILSFNIYNALCDPTMKNQINTNNQYHFSSLFIQKLDIKTTTNGDALISEFSIRVIGCIS